MAFNQCKLGRFSPDGASFESLTAGLGTSALMALTMRACRGAGEADTGGLALSFTYEISVDGGAFAPGASTLPSFPYQALVECPGTNNCSYRVTAHNAKGDSPASGAMSTDCGTNASPRG